MDANERRIETTVEAIQEHAISWESFAGQQRMNIDWDVVRREVQQAIADGNITLTAEVKLLNAELKVWTAEAERLSEALDDTLYGELKAEVERLRGLLKNLTTLMMDAPDNTLMMRMTVMIAKALEQAEKPEGGAT